MTFIFLKLKIEKKENNISQWQNKFDKVENQEIITNLQQFQNSFAYNKLYRLEEKVKNGCYQFC